MNNLPKPILAFIIYSLFAIFYGQFPYPLPMPKPSSKQVCKAPPYLKKNTYIFLIQINLLLIIASGSPRMLAEYSTAYT